MNEQRTFGISYFLYMLVSAVFGAAILKYFNQLVSPYIGPYTFYIAYGILLGIVLWNLHRESEPTDRMPILFPFFLIPASVIVLFLFVEIVGAWTAQLLLSLLNFFSTIPSYKWIYSISVPLVILIGSTLYFLKAQAQWIYGIIELTFSLGFAMQASEKVWSTKPIHGAITHELDFAAWTACVTAIYLFQRGLDNFAQGFVKLKNHQELIKSLDQKMGAPNNGPFSMLVGWLRQKGAVK
jgi:hypothetical protein